ncbi:hypothetical protein [Celeribacter baekdonensis]|uniref:hypothetical protein n=1 Tax=Celeribacter baekdonensis TaxID=875171 RepID=UPI003A911766
MEFLKELFDEGRARVKSNVFASVVFAFVVVNWKSIYFVVFADATAIEKFEFFDGNTCVLSLYVWPPLIGAVLAIGMPFINNIAHWLVSKPIGSVRSRDDKQAHARLQKKNEWAAVRNAEQKIFEDKLVAQAETDDRISKIEDKAIREEVKEKVSEGRSEAHSEPKIKAAEANLANLRHKYFSGLRRLENMSADIAGRQKSLNDKKQASVVTLGVNRDALLMRDATEVRDLEEQKIRLQVELDSMKAAIADADAWLNSAKTT